MTYDVRNLFSGVFLLMVFGVFYCQEVFYTFFVAGSRRHIGKSPDSSFATEGSAVFVRIGLWGLSKGFYVPISSPIEGVTKTKIRDVVER